MNLGALRVCVDRILPETAREQHDTELDPEVVRRLRLAADKRKTWPGNWRALAVRFLEGDARLHARIAQVAAQWSRHANIRFVFNNARAAPIRVAFVPGASWSYIGTDALDPRIGLDEPTMNFGWLHSATPEDELQRVVLHEFGHALGMIHEHQSPAAAIPWDRAAVYRYYSGPPNHWTPEEVDRNVFARYAHDTTNASEYDPLSIMQYPIPPEFTGGAFVAGWNRELSPQDRAHIGKVYPFDDDARHR